MIKECRLLRYGLVGARLTKFESEKYEGWQLDNSQPPQSKTIVVRSGEMGQRT